MLGQLYAKIREWLVTTKPGFKVLVFFAPFFLLPSDIKSPGNIYGRLARNYMNTLWAAFIFTASLSHLFFTSVTEFTPTLLEGGFYGIIRAGDDFHILMSISFFLLAILIIIVGSAASWSFNKIFGAIVQRCGGIVDIPSYNYFRLQWSIAICWIGAFGSIAAFTMPYITGSKTMPNQLQDLAADWMIILPVLVIVLLSMRRDHNKRVSEAQMYPNPWVRLLRGTVVVLLLGTTMFSLPLLLAPQT